MSEDETQEHVRRWLTDDISVLNGALIVAASSVALVFASLCVWRAKHYHVDTEPTRDHREHLDNSSDTSTAQSVLTAALSSLHIVSLTPGEYNTPPTNQPISSESSSKLDVDQMDHKAHRSKERRRRGKDPYKDLLKGGKKSKALLKAAIANEYDHDHSRSGSPLAEADSKSKTAGSDTLLSPSRSQSSDSASRESSTPDRVPPASTESDHDSVQNTTLGGHTSSFPDVTSSSNASGSDFSSDLPSHSDGVGQYSLSDDPITIPDTDVNVSSSSATVISPAEVCPSYPAASTGISGSRTTQSLHSWEVDFQVESNGMNSTKPARFRTKPRTSQVDVNDKPQASSSMPSFSFNEVASPSPSVSAASSPSSSLASSPYMPPVTFPSLNPQPIDARDFNHSTFVRDVGPSTPITSRAPTPAVSLSRPESTHPPQASQAQQNSQAANQTAIQVSAQTQLASMRGALEAARRREEKLRAEAGRSSKECEELRWRWNEDTGSWRRREAELQTQIHYLMQQLQAYAALASFQAQQSQTGPSSGFSSPSSPSSHTHQHLSPRVHHHPLIPHSLQSQNPASAPAHVQALLATAPMLTSHHQAFAAVGAGGGHSGMGAGMSPLLWSGLGFSAPNRNGARGAGQLTPDSSASGSPSRGRRRRRQAEDVKSASDDSSLGEWDGVEENLGPDVDEGDHWEKGEDPGEAEDDILRNNMLADAILKRPESIREFGSVGKRSGSGRVPSRTSVTSDGGVAVTPFTNGSNREQEMRVNEHSESTRGGGGDTLDAPKDQESVVDKLDWTPLVVDNPAANSPLNPTDDGPNDKQ
ncbi:hypothetical protein PAXINDRAFT_101100 [Paxillus involutus ATCC 200175]|uniref:Transmembrane protein n=1 Tax=Paxillus involutus ATCC 200175 TaxID=664439 RepID=A0A0C9TAZ4_PAXIN|nr:hypothetical protein PAXINDRAFT_101100 [Paxillus involutus ATCC 200175]